MKVEGNPIFQCTRDRRRLSRPHPGDECKEMTRSDFDWITAKIPSRAQYAFLFVAHLASPAVNGSFDRVLDCIVRRPIKSEIIALASPALVSRRRFAEKVIRDRQSASVRVSSKHIPTSKTPAVTRFTRITHARRPCIFVSSPPGRSRKETRHSAR